MANIAEKLEGVIDKLDTMSSSPIPRTYGLDIASRVEHIAKQLDYVQAGGGTGGGSIMFVNIDIDSLQGTTYQGHSAQSFLCDKTLPQIFEHLENGGIAYFRSHMINDSVALYFINYGEQYVADDSIHYLFRGTKMEISTANETVIQTIVVYDSDFSEERVVIYDITK